MSRNKTVKRPLTSTALASVQKIEKMQKHLFKVPAKLINELHKEIKNHRKKEVKLKSAINKIKTELNKSESFIKNASEKTGKKQIKKAKNSHSKVTKIHLVLNKDLQKNADSLESLELNQAKLIALHKSLNQFEKDWAKNAKKLINDVQPKPKQQKKVKIKAASPKLEQPLVENPVVSLDNIGFEETSEMAS